MNLKAPAIKPSGQCPDIVKITVKKSHTPVSFANTNPSRSVDSRELFGQQATLLIHHMGEIYRLQTTRQGKLILTK